jgi:hypothetical protein
LVLCVCVLRPSTIYAYPNLGWTSPDPRRSNTLGSPVQCLTASDLNPAGSWPTTPTCGICVSTLPDPIPARGEGSEKPAGRATDQLCPAPSARWGWVVGTYSSEPTVTHAADLQLTRRALLIFCWEHMDRGDRFDLPSLLTRRNHPVGCAAPHRRNRRCRCQLAMRIPGAARDKAGIVFFFCAAS